jgi:hypothetical protein
VTQEPSRSGQDPIGDFQRWLVRSGARSVSREVGDQIRSMLGLGGGPADVWSRATAPPADEAPECAWCPFCRAARVLRESGPGVSSQMAAAGEAVGVLARDAMSVVESALGATGRAAKAGTGQAPSSTIWADVTAEAGETVPDPGDAVPDPGKVTPGPDDAAPEPGDAVPEPGDAVPEPGDAVPDPGKVTPGPEDAAPEPGEAVPDPGEEPESAGPPGGPPHGPDDRG